MLTDIMADAKYNRIKVALAEKDRPNKWLATKLGKTEMTVSRWVSNRSQPSIEQLFEIAKALEMEARLLINTNEDVFACLNEGSRVEGIE